MHVYFLHSGQVSTTNTAGLILPPPLRTGLAAAAAAPCLWQLAGARPCRGGDTHDPRLPALQADAAPPKCLRGLRRAKARPRVPNRRHVWPSSPDVTFRCLSLPRRPNRWGFLQQTKGRHKNASPRASDRGDVRCLSLLALYLLAVVSISRIPPADPWPRRGVGEGEEGRGPEPRASPGLGSEGSWASSPEEEGHSFLSSFNIYCRSHR